MLSDDETMVVQRAYMRYREAYNGPFARTTVCGVLLRLRPLGHGGGAAPVSGAHQAAHA